MLWEDGIKTLFDPCPAGWRVPESGAGDKSVWSAFSAENGTWNEANNDPSGGYHYSGVSAQGSPWYPASGFFTPAGKRSGTGSWIHNWNCTAHADRSYCFRISYTDFTPNATNVRNHGFPVRCVRE